MFRPPPSPGPHDPPDIFFKHHLRLYDLMRGNNPTSQIRVYAEIEDIWKDGKDRQRFEARLREQLVNWTPPPDVQWGDFLVS